MKRTSLPCGCARACFLPALAELPLGCHVIVSVDSSDQKKLYKFYGRARCPVWALEDADGVEDVGARDWAAWNAALPVRFAVQAGGWCEGAPMIARPPARARPRAAPPD